MKPQISRKHHEKKEPKVLYGEQTLLTLENMSFSGISLSTFPEFIINAAKVKKACAIANYLADNLSNEQLRRITLACNELIEGKHLDQFPVDVFHGGGGIGVNMNLNEVIASLAGGDVDAVETVNMSQSTSDVCHTAMRMTIDEMLQGLLNESQLMAGTLKEKAKEFAHVDTIARTCFQDGMRVSSGAIFEATASAITRRHRSLSETSRSMRNINLGWTVIGSGIGASEKYREVILDELANITGRQFSWNEDMYDAAEYPDDLADVSAELRVIAEILAKLSRDLRILSSGPEAGFEELILPAVQKGSSFFPGKVNPVIPETMIQCSLLISGNDSIIQSCVGAGEIHINLWEDMMGFLLINNIRRLTTMMHLFRTKCLDGIRLNEEKCEQYASSSIPSVVDYKEEFGYQELTDRIKEKGVKTTIAEIKEEQSNKKKGES